MDRTYKLLLLDDDEADRMAVRRLLSAGPLSYQLTEASSVDGARAALAEGFDCILLDFRLAGVDGLTLLRELRDAYASLPIVVLTDQSDRETAVSVMKAGASDFLPKTSATPQLVAQSIRAAVRTHRAERAARSAREARDRSELRYRFLAESIPQMVWIANADLSLEYVNRRYTEYTGLPLDALGEQGLEAALHPDDLAGSRVRWGEARALRSAYEYQHRLRAHATGEYRWHLSRSEPLLDPAGAVQQWFGTSTDIDDQKRLEERQTARMHESEAARRHAEELNRAKDDFLAVLSVAADPRLVHGGGPALARGDREHRAQHAHADAAHRRPARRLAHRVGEAEHPAPSRGAGRGATRRGRGGDAERSQPWRFAHGRPAGAPRPRARRRQPPAASGLEPAHQRREVQ